MITRLLVDGFINLINTGNYSDEELKEILTMMLSDDTDLAKLMKLFFKSIHK